MPPGQPVHRCAGACGRLRPCKLYGARWYCRECHPALSPTRTHDGPQATDSAHTGVATDGGRSQ